MIYVHLNNMVLHRSVHKLIGAAESTVFTVLGPNSDGITVFLQNQDGLNFISYRFQQSSTNIDDDYTNLTDTGSDYGVSGTLSPGARAMVSIRSSSPFVRMLSNAPGGAELAYSISQFSNGAAVYYNNGTQ